MPRCRRIGNVPPRTGEDPHGDPRNSADSQTQKDEFLRTGGTLIDVCAGAPARPRHLIGTSSRRHLACRGPNP